MEKNAKTKFQESKIYKAFRRITSLGLAGVLAIAFPNEIVAWLSAGAGFLYGKGIISLAAMTGIVTFLGSAGGLLVQKIVLCGLTYLFSNIILKQTRKIAGLAKTKIKSLFKGKNNVKIEPKKTNVVSNVKIKEQVKEQTKEPELNIQNTVNKVPNKVKTLGVHPSTKR